jgi:hypothetical protein
VEIDPLSKQALALIDRESEGTLLKVTEWQLPDDATLSAAVG